MNNCQIQPGMLLSIVVISLKIKIDNKYIEIKEANNYLSRLIGLIGKRNIDYGMYFPKCNSIHTLFMKENINVIGLDEENIVIYKALNIKPYRFVRVKNKKTNILELPKNIGINININDTLCFEEENII